MSETKLLFPILLYRQSEPTESYQGDHPAPVRFSPGAPASKEDPRPAEAVEDLPSVDTSGEQEMAATRGKEKPIGQALSFCAEVIFH